ncbi:hypothetical protein TNCV_1476001 [Trichonephila clavipes]|nr:hypothetical protein TNCV_1476001 [Trichonephila clavipes]
MSQIYELSCIHTKAVNVERLANKNFISSEMNSLIGSTIHADSLGVNATTSPIALMLPYNVGVVVAQWSRYRIMTGVL